MNRKESQQEIDIIETEGLPEEFVDRRILDYVSRFGYNPYSIRKVEKHLFPRIRNYLNWVRHKS